MQHLSFIKKNLCIGYAQLQWNETDQDSQMVDSNGIEPNSLSDTLLFFDIDVRLVKLSH